MSEANIFEDSRELFICSLIASMYHMALVDGKYDPEERRFISKTISKYPEFYDAIRKITNSFEKANLKEEFIVNLLRQCRDKFSEEQRYKLVEHSVKVLEADGIIHEKEQMLVKTYLYTLGLNPRLVKKMIDKELPNKKSN